MIALQTWYFSSDDKDCNQTCEDQGQTCLVQQSPVLKEELATITGTLGITCASYLQCTLSDDEECENAPFADTPITSSAGKTTWDCYFATVPAECDEDADDQRRRFCQCEAAATADSSSRRSSEALSSSSPCAGVNLSEAVPVYMVPINLTEVLEGGQSVEGRSLLFSLKSGTALPGIHYVPYTVEVFFDAGEVGIHHFLLCVADLYHHIICHTGTPGISPSVSARSFCNIAIYAHCC